MCVCVHVCVCACVHLYVCLCVCVCVLIYTPPAPPPTCPRLLEGTPTGSRKEATVCPSEGGREGWPFSALTIESLKEFLGTQSTVEESSLCLCKLIPFSEHIQCSYMYTTHNNYMTLYGGTLVFVCV